MYMGPNDFHQMTKQIEVVRDQFVVDKQVVAAVYPTVDPTHDARITAYSKSINVLNSVQLSFAFISKHLLNGQWWAMVAHNPISNNDKQIYTREFASFTKVAFVQGLFHSTESSLRLFLRAIDSTACNGGMAEFKSIYECLFISKLSARPTNGVALLDLLRLVRNTIHNNGVYFHKSGNNALVTWEGENYEFRQGEPVDFVSWQFLIRVAEALRVLMHEVVVDSSLRAISVEITDPFSY